MTKQSLEERIAKVAHATAVESRKNTGDRYSKLKTVTGKRWIDNDEPVKMLPLVMTPSLKLVLDYYIANYLEKNT